MSFEEELYAFAHEIGHNLNAKHDENTIYCKNGPKYIMSMSGATEDSKSFSQCSIQAIQERIVELRAEDKIKYIKCLKNLTETSYDDLVVSETKDG